MTTHPPTTGEKYREICSQSNPTHYKGEHPDCEACRDWCPKCQRAYTACYCHDQGEQVAAQETPFERAVRLAKGRQGPPEKPVLFDGGANSPATEKASETPRTDKELKRTKALWESWPRRWEGAEQFARTLERGLTAAQRQNEELREKLEETKRSLEFCRYWWGTRSETLSQWVRKNKTTLPREFVEQYFSIIANGSPSPTECPPFAAQLNTQIHRAERAESKADQQAAEVDRLRSVLDQVDSLITNWMRGADGNVLVKAQDLLLNAKEAAPAGERVGSSPGWALLRPDGSVMHVYGGGDMSPEREENILCRAWEEIRPEDYEGAGTPVGQAVSMARELGCGELMTHGHECKPENGREGA